MRTYKIMDKLFLIGFGVLISVGVAESRRTLPEGSCRYSRVFKMLGADCSNINLINIPNITRDVEVLDASVNRIRTLKNNSFVTYYSLKFLYLGDNSISIIEPGAFEPLVYLEVLDLSLNSIRDVPALLPSTLRRLYLSENIVETAPLEKAVSLQFVSFADCRLKKIPDIGVLPNLLEMNLTGNPMESLTVDQLAAFCQLETLRLPRHLFQTQFPTTCDCVKVASWTVRQAMYLDPPMINCSVIDESECVSNSSTEARTYVECQAAHQALHWRGPSAWMLILGAFIVILVAAVILTILWRRRYAKPKPPPPQPSGEEVRKRQLLKRSMSRSRGRSRSRNGTSRLSSVVTSKSTSSVIHSNFPSNTSISSPPPK